MSDVLTPPPDAGDISIARLHGEACWHCGIVFAELVPIGDVTVNGRTWPVVGCAAHRGRP